MRIKTLPATLELEPMPLTIGTQLALLPICQRFLAFNLTL